MSRILIFPFPEFGHISPTLSLAKTLRSAGHSITYLTAPQFKAHISAVGATLEPMIQESPQDAHFSGTHIWYRFVKESFVDNRSSATDALLSNVLRQSSFDLVLCDRIISQTLRRSVDSLVGNGKLILYSTSLVNWGSYESTQPVLPTLIFCPESLELPQFRVKARGLIYVEPSLRPLSLENYHDDRFLLHGTRPLVLVTFGSQSVRYRDLSDRIALIWQLAAQSPKIQFIVSTGITSSEAFAAVNPPLDNFTVHSNIPQRALLTSAQAIITHGGLGTIKEAIFAAKPMIVLPISHDQPYNAMRVRHHRLGQAIFSERLSLTLLAAELTKALDGIYSNELIAMRERFVSMEHSRLSHLLIEGRLSSIESASMTDF